MVVVVSGGEGDAWTADLAERLRSLSVDVALVAGPSGLDKVAADILDLAERAPSRSAVERHHAVRQALAQLTPAEKRTLLALVDGDAAEDVAIRTGTSITTVRTHIRNVLSKLGVHSQRHAVALALRAGWTDERSDPVASTAGAR